MLLDLFKLFVETEPLHYFYLFLGLIGISIIVIRQKLSIEDDLTHYLENHPERTEKQSSITRLHFLQITLTVLMTLVTIAGVFRYTIGDTGERLIQKYDDYLQWDDKPISQSFVTYGRFTDAGTIKIKYDLIIDFPNGKELEALKYNYRNPTRILNNYLKPYLFLISTATCNSYSTKDAYTNISKFRDSIKYQVLNGVYPSLGVGVASPQSYGIIIEVNNIEYNFEDTTVRKLFKRRDVKDSIDTLMEDWVNSQKEKK